MTDLRPRPGAPASADPSRERGALTAHDAAIREMFVLLYAAAGRLRTMRRTLARGMGIDTSELEVVMALDYLESTGRTTRVRDIAALMHSAAPNVTSTLRKLEARGWVRKDSSLNDNRSLTVALTPRARAQLDRLRDTLRAVNDVWFGDVGTATVDTVRGFIDQLIDHHPAAHALCESLHRAEPED